MKPYANSAKAWGLCDRCGARFRLGTLKKLVVKDTQTELKVCRDCWEPSHPQLRLGEVKVDDPQALYEPRPDKDKKTSTEYVDFEGQPANSTTGVPFDFPFIN